MAFWSKARKFFPRLIVLVVHDDNVEHVHKGKDVEARVAQRIKRTHPALAPAARARVVKNK